MHTVIKLFALMSFSFLIWADDYPRCFEIDKSQIVIKRGGSKNIFHLRLASKKEFDLTVYCFNNQSAYTCIADDDGGQFELGHTSVVMKSKLTFGSPEKSITLGARKKKAVLKKCSK